MMILAAAPAPHVGDLVLVPMARGCKLAHVMGFDPSNKNLEYAMTYADTKDPKSMDFKGYTLMDEETPRVWRQPGQKIRMRAQFRACGKTQVIERMAPSRTAMRSLALTAFGQQLIGEGHTIGRRVYEAKVAIMLQNNASYFDPKLITVTFL